MSNLTYHPCLLYVKSSFFHMFCMCIAEVRLNYFTGLVPTHREILSLTDGGTIVIEWAYERPQEKQIVPKLGKTASKGQQFELPLDQRPILVIFLGLASCIHEIYAQNTCRDAWNAGYQPVLVLHRGFDGRLLDHHHLIGFAEWKIVYEVVDQLHAAYCEHTDRKLFMLTYSLSGNWAALALAFKAKELKSKITAAMLIQPPLNLKAVVNNIRNCYYGFLDWGLLAKSKAVMQQKNINYLKPIY